LETIASETKDVAWSVYTVITARLSFTPRRLVASRKDCLALSVEKTAHVEVRCAGFYLLAEGSGGIFAAQTPPPWLP